jgi:GTP1/Obg family GTP-binding protein
MIIQCRTVAELGRDYTTLNAARAALDERIHRASTSDPATPSLEPLHPLWTELEDVLSQQEAILAVLADTAAATLTELRIKTDVLDRLMRPGRDNPVETEAGRKLAASIVRDIQTQFGTSPMPD